MNAGRIEQLGTPTQVYEEPATAFVAKFLGEPNVLAARVVSVADGEIACELEGGYRVVSGRKAPVQAGDRVDVIVRAERVRLARNPSGLPNSFPARLEHVMYLGSDLRYLVQFGPHRLIALVTGRSVASYLQRAGPRERAALMLLVVSPLLVSLVIRSYGWVIVLGPRGLVNSVLTGLHLVSAPLKLMYTETAVVVGLTHVF